jgi:sulfur carrier protein
MVKICFKFIKIPNNGYIKYLIKGISDKLHSSVVCKEINNELSDKVKTMKIIVNGRISEIDPVKSTIAQILANHNVSKPEMVSVQLNEKFIGQEQFENTRLVENDELEFIYFMGGGMKLRIKR